jgi:pilus assembly protein CpaF
VPARLEALAALGGLDRAALHSQLAAAVQVLIHVNRGPRGRRLAEIALLCRKESGRVGTQAVWRVDRGLCDGIGPLRELIAERRGG